MREVLDGTSSALCFGERAHRDVAYSGWATANARTTMDGYGFWAPSTGLPGLGDVTLGSDQRINYRHPKSGTIPNQNSSEDARVAAHGSEHVGGSHVTLCDGSARLISENIDQTIRAALGTRATGVVFGEFQANRIEYQNPLCADSNQVPSRTGKKIKGRWSILSPTTSSPRFLSVSQTSSLCHFLTVNCPFRPAM